MQRKVAVITRTKDRPLLLQRCLLSVLNQTYHDWLHVIVNDGGDPAAVEAMVSRFAARYQDRIKVLHNEKSVGMQNASNLAIRASESEYVTIHDDDDTWHGMFLEECVGHLDAAGPASTEQGVAAQSWWIMEEIDSWGNVVEISRKDYLPFDTISLFQTARRNPFPPISFLYRRKAHDTVGYFDQSFNELGDYDFNLRFLSHFDIGTVHKRLAGYHWRHQTGGSSYGNTVTDGLSGHRNALVKMQNRYLRQDLAKQQMGLGFLINTASSFEAQVGMMDGLHEKSDRVVRALTKTTKKLERYEQMLEGILAPWKSRTLPRRLYDHVSDLVLPPANGAPRNGAVNGSGQSTNLPAGAQKARVLSLDVFDTALLRLVRRPTDVFLYIQNEVRRLLNRPTLGFVEARITAEEESRQETMRTRGTRETTLDDIYAVLRRRLDCDEETTRQIKELELQAESTLCYANPHIAKLVAKSGKDGPKIVFASDMYLPPTAVKDLLKKNGFKDAPLFLSSELAVSKSEGGLFDHLLSNLNCPPGDALHVGDNPHSDVSRPQAKGMTAHHWTRTSTQTALVDQHNSFSGAWEGDLASSLYTGLVRRRRLTHPVEQTSGRKFWEMIGYEVMGPMHHAYVAWVIKRAREMGLKKLYFLARDGYHLLNVFELFRQQGGVDIETQYLFASRRLWNVPRVDGLDEENMVFLVTPNPCMRVKDFLSRIGIDPAPHEAAARRHGFKSLDESVTKKTGVFLTEEHHQNMRRFIREFEGQILDQARKERKTLVEYFKDAGLLGDQVGIVDIGWLASSSRSLQVLLALEGQPRRIPAFYFSTWTYAQPVIEAGCLLESFLMHLGRPLHRAWILQESVELVEAFFSAPHPTIIGISKQNGKWEPVYGEREVDAKRDAELAIAAAAALEFTRDALAIWPKSQEIAPAFGYMETILERLLRFPTRDEATALGDLSWRNTFGGTGPLRHLARPPTHWERISRRDALQDGYDQCYWKKGFLAQLSARAKQYINP